MQLLEPIADWKTYRQRKRWQCKHNAHMNNNLHAYISCTHLMNKTIFFCVCFCRFDCSSSSTCTYGNSFSLWVRPLFRLLFVNVFFFCRVCWICHQQSLPFIYFSFSWNQFELSGHKDSIPIEYVLDRMNTPYEFDCSVRRNRASNRFRWTFG